MDGKIFRLLIKTGSSWRWGLKDYMKSAANKRVKELAKVGIKAVVKPIEELLKPIEELAG